MRRVNHSRTLIRGLGSDVRHAWRGLRRSGGFTAGASVVLALGIGASATVLTIADTALLRGLPYPDSERILSVDGIAFERHASYLDAPATVRTARGVEHAALYGAAAVNLDAGGTPERVALAAVSPDFFALMREPAFAGRTLARDEFSEGTLDRAVVSHGLWLRRFGGSPAAIGQRIMLNGRPFTVMGVMPPGFDFPAGSEVWVPLSLPGFFSGAVVFRFLARVAPGVSLAEAQTEIATRWRQRPGAAAAAADRPQVRRLQDTLAAGIRPRLVTAGGAVALVLMLACLNVANLLLARATVRQQELAVRAALGAGRAQLVRFMLVESALLAGFGGGLGIVASTWCLSCVSTWLPVDVTNLHRVAVDARFFAIATLLILATVFLCGMLPALIVSQTDLHAHLRSGGGLHHDRRRLSALIVVGEIALALVLVAGAGLFLGSLGHVLTIPTGLRPEGVLTFELFVPQSRCPDATDCVPLLTELRSRLRSLPTVIEVGAVNNLPLTGRLDMRIPIEVAGRPGTTDVERPLSSYRVASPGYFAAVGMSVLAGRDFSDSDTATRPRVAVVNEALARRLWGNPAQVGERIRFVTDEEKGEWAEVVGVVGNVHHDGPDRDVKTEAYWSLAQEGWRSVVFAVRTTSPPADLVSPIQDVLRRLAPDVPIYAVRPMQEIYDASVASRRFLANITTVFAGTALILAAVGTFGVTRYVVGLRRRELGVRLALGATPMEIRGLVLRQTLGYGLGGIVLGAVGAFVLGRFVQSLLFEVSASDPTIVGTAAAVLLAVAGLAGYGPARQASRLDPLSVLRAE